MTVLKCSAWRMRSQRDAVMMCGSDVVGVETVGCMCNSYLLLIMAIWYKLEPAERH